MVNVLDLKHAPLAADPVVVDEDDFDDPAMVVAGPLDAPREVAWEAHQVPTERSRYRHLVALAAFTFVGGLVSVWQASVLTFVTVVLGVAAWELHERFSRPVRVHVGERGVNVDGHQYSHATLSSFDVHQMPDGTVELSLATNVWHSPRLRLPLGDQDPGVVRGVLLQYVPEDSHIIPLVDWLIHKG